MSLPACQQRVLNAIEESLQASEPRLASMFAIFTRLTKGEEPTSAERLPARSRRWHSARQVRTFVLIPVMAAIALSGVLLGVTTRGAQACGVVYAAGRGAAVRSVAGCARPLPEPAAKKEPATRQMAKTEPRTGQAARTEPAMLSAMCAQPYLELAWHRVCYR